MMFQPTTIKHLASAMVNRSTMPNTDPATTNWWVYIVQTVSGKLYTGITTDIQRRFSEHQSGRKGARFFRSDAAHSIVYQEPASNRSTASKREAAIKKLSRAAKLQLIEAAEQSCNSCSDSVK